MKRRWLYLAAGGLLLALVVVLAWPRVPKEPRYQGSPLTYWVAACSSVDKTREAVRADGAASRRYLLWVFSLTDSSSPKLFWDVLRKIGIDPRARYKGSILSAHKMAVQGLILLGPDLAPALPELASYLDNARRGDQAAYLMGQAGEAAIPYLTKALFSRDAQMSYRGQHGIYSLSKVSDSIYPVLFRYLEDRDPRRRALAARALGDTTGQFEQVAAALGKALSDRDSLVQLEAVKSLEVKGPGARVAVPQVQSLLTSTNSDLAAAAQSAIQRIGRGQLGR